MAAPAGVGDNLAFAAALRAGGDGITLHPEEPPHGLTYLAAAMAGRTRLDVRCVLGPLPAALRTRPVVFNGHRLGTALGDFFQGQGHPGPDILPPAGTRARGAAKTAEIPEVEPAATEIEAAATENAAQDFVQVKAAEVESTASAHLVSCEAKLVIPGFLLRVAEHGIGFRRLLEVFFGGLFLRIRSAYPAVRMPLEGQFPVGGLDFVRRSGLTDTQDLVVISFLCHTIMLPQLL